MRKIDTWLFIVFLIGLYLTFFWLINFLAIPIFNSTFLKNIGHASYILVPGALLAFFFSVFGLRSYYILPASPLKITNIIIATQTILFALSIFFIKPDISDLGIWLLNTGATWIVSYFSLTLADRHFRR